MKSINRSVAKLKTEQQQPKYTKYKNMFVLFLPFLFRQINFKLWSLLKLRCVKSPKIHSICHQHIFIHFVQKRQHFFKHCSIFRHRMKQYDTQFSALGLNIHTYLPYTGPWHWPGAVRGSQEETRRSSASGDAPSVNEMALEFKLELIGLRITCSFLHHILLSLAVEVTGDLCNYGLYEGWIRRAGQPSILTLCYDPFESQIFHIPITITWAGGRRLWQ